VLGTLIVLVGGCGLAVVGFVGFAGVRGQDEVIFADDIAEEDVFADVPDIAEPDILERPVPPLDGGAEPPMVTAVVVDGDRGDTAESSGPPITEPFLPGPEGPYGSRDVPLPNGQPSLVERPIPSTGRIERWTVTVGPLRDVTTEVLGSDPGSEDGFTYAAFDVTLEIDPPAPSADEEPGQVEDEAHGWSWAIIGGSTDVVQRAVFDEVPGCQAWPSGPVDASNGEPVTGTVCVRLFPDDLGHPATVISLDLAPERFDAYYGT
jgi:hypothetical protein